MMATSKNITFIWASILIFLDHDEETNQRKQLLSYYFITAAISVTSPTLRYNIISHLAFWILRHYAS